MIIQSSKLMKFSIVKLNICRPSHKKDRNDEKNRTITEADRDISKVTKFKFLLFFFINVSSLIYDRNFLPYKSHL